MRRRLKLPALALTTRALLVLAALVGGSACVTDDSVVIYCEDSNLVCPPTARCADSGQRCDPIGCGDGRVDRDNGEVCDDGNLVSGDGCSEDCRVLESCGDGKRDPGEVCDDSDPEDDGACSLDCQSTLDCGDGVQNPGEQCDEGSATGGGNGGDNGAGPSLSTMSCDADCTLPQCGDGFLKTRRLSTP